MLPTGTLTMMFTDIEGSTSLLQRLGDRYADALTAQRSILRSAISEWGGHEMGTEGDSFFVVFESAQDAVNAAAQAQLELLAHQWPGDESVRVRIGLHSGEPSQHEDGYVGIDVHRAARIAASAHGGQVVLSEATRMLAATRLPAEAVLSDLGWHRFKDLLEPEHVHQLTASGCPDDFPPLKSLGTRVALPQTATALVGRDEQIAELRRLLTAKGARLVTLTGPGGTGKTRLAIGAAAALDDSFTDGVYFVPLAAVRSAAVMWTTIAEALGATGDQRSPHAFLKLVHSWRALLVLDNLEQLPDASQVVDELLRAAPRLSLLATSRRPLHVAGEYEQPVPPMDVPANAAVDAEAAAGCSGIQLFVQRAQQVRPAFALTDDNAADIVELCQRLDGLPLAIELAAARVRLLSPRALLARLDRALELASNEVGKERRQQTLRNTIAWSYELLSPTLQRSFRWLGVFRGGCELDAFSAAVQPAGDPLDVVSELVDASLAKIGEGAEGEPRIGVLQMIGAFAREQLEAEGELHEASRHHAEHYVGVVEALAGELRGSGQLTARDRLEAELENIRSALRWALGTESQSRAPTEQALALGLRLCQGMSWFWYASGYPTEGRHWQSRAITLVGDQESPELMATLHSLAVLLAQQGRNEDSRDALTRSLTYWRKVGDLNKVAMELNSLGAVNRSLGQPGVSRSMLLESIELSRQLGEIGRLTSALCNLGLLEVDMGRPEAAIELLEEALDLDHRQGDAWGVAADQVNLTAALVSAGRVDEGQARLRGAAVQAIRLRDVELTVNVFELFCVIAAEQGDALGAARLLAMTQRMREQSELPADAPDIEMLERSIAKVRPSVSDADWERNVETGREYSVERALAEVLGDDPSGPA